METVVYDETPFSEYLKDEGEGGQPDWAPVEPDQNVVDVDTPPPSPPTTSFAPVGRPLVQKRFRGKKPDPLRVDIPIGTNSPSSFRSRYSKAVASRIDRADNAKFIEQFRYTIVASQLLSGHSILGPHHVSSRQGQTPPEAQDEGDHVPLTAPGLAFTIAGAVAVAWMLSWVYSGGYSHLTKKRFIAGLVVIGIAASVGHAYIRQRWLRHVRGRALSEMTTFVSASQDFDSATSAAVALVQEVELVSRGYRISVPLPPVSRLEERGQVQTRRCARLRKALRLCLEDCLPKYRQTCDVMKGFSEQLDLEKYYDIYDISDFDISDALQGFQVMSEDGLEKDLESLRTFKVVAARLHTLRKIFLCALLALEATGDNPDFLRWATVAEGLRSINEATRTSYERLSAILGEEDAFPTSSTPKMPLSPSRERWRSQLNKLNSLSAGIRGLQAKLTLLREESDRSLNQASDVSELGPSLMAQYDSIGQDLKMLTHAWEDGKAALASGIDRNEKRLSSMSSLLLSPTISLSGRTTVDEGGVADALKALNGDSPSAKSLSSPEVEEVFEAVAMPRPRSTLTREERLAKMKADRERKAEMRENNDNGRFMLRELETVLNLKSGKLHSKRASTGRVSL